MKKRIVDLEKEIEQLKKERDELIKIVQPFANYVDKAFNRHWQSCQLIDDTPLMLMFPCADGTIPRITIGDCRVAHKFLNKRKTK